MPTATMSRQREGGAAPAHVAPLPRPTATQRPPRRHGKEREAQPSDGGMVLGSIAVNKGGDKRTRPRGSTARRDALKNTKNHRQPSVIFLLFFFGKGATQSRYPSLYKSSAVRSPPPAAPLSVLCESPTNFQSNMASSRSLPAQTPIPP